MVSSGEVLVLNVARAKIVRSAQDAVRRARELGHLVTPADERRLLRVARKHPEFTLGSWWNRERGCGCLTGNLLGTDGVRQQGEVFYRIGLAFDTALRDRLTFRQRTLEDRAETTIVRAVDR